MSPGGDAGFILITRLNLNPLLKRRHSLKYYRDNEGGIWKVKDDILESPNDYQMPYSLEGYLYIENEWWDVEMASIFGPYTLISYEEAFIELL